MAQPAALTCDEFLDLAAAVALDAADAEDSRRVEEHAAACPDCGRHLVEFREVAAALGAHVAQVDPPAALRRRVLEAVAGAPQEPRPILSRLASRRRVSPAWLV